jgi:AraC-like DNA-binding protein
MQKVKNSLNPYSDVRVRKALQIIDREPNQTISAVAQQLKLSKSRFSHLFKAETGTSVKSYVVSRRLRKAAHLLRATGMEIKEVAYLLGYQHGPSFTRVFKAQFGVTPNQYRKAEKAASTRSQLNLLIPAPAPGNTARQARLRSEKIRADRTTRSRALKAGSLAS